MNLLPVPGEQHNHTDDGPINGNSSRPNPLNHHLLHADISSSSTICLLPFIDDIVQQLVTYQQQQSSSSSSFCNSSDLLSFPLVFDPRSTPRALIMGMFVVRPSLVPWSSSLAAPFATFATTLHDTAHQWAFNYRGLDGGWLIGDQNVLDAFRLAFQYGVSDAVIISSMTVAMEGVDKDHDHRGYMWQPYAVTDWPHLKAACPNALDLITRQREAWQHQGYISMVRKYPAQIIFTESGERYHGSSDFLSARILTDHHPSGESIECYILTGHRGAQNIRKRVNDEFPHLRERLDTMILLLPDADDDGAAALPSGGRRVDISLVPELLYNRLGMRLVNHDGGQQVLRAFSRAGTTVNQNTQSISRSFDSGSICHPPI